MKGLNKLNKEYMYDGEKSYLVISIPVQNEIKHYQLEMLERNNIEPLLPLTVQRFNEEQRLYYEITSKISIDRIFERRRINAKEFEYIVLFIELLYMTSTGIFSSLSATLDACSFPFSVIPSSVHP